jgi:hypothetical protein
MPIKYILPKFSYAFTRNSSSFYAIITSSSNNKLHASMNNHFKCSIVFNGFGMKFTYLVYHSVYNNIFRVGHKLLVSGLKYKILGLWIILFFG